jgi:hypothetical protein
MASYFALYYYVVTIVDDSIVINDGPLQDINYQSLVSAGQPGAGEFSVGQSISFNGGTTNTYTGQTSEGPVIQGTYLHSNNAGLTVDQSLPYLVSAFTVCFLAGTRIRTPEGDVPVEALSIGDFVMTADGRTAPVRWVGVQSVVTLFADPLRTLPIRIAAGALAEGLPVRDLCVSPDHALMLDGVLVQAGALVNGMTIVRQTAMPERFTYYHVELDDHALILAEGVAAETFVDNVTRRRFDNFAEYAALYGDTAAAIAEMDAPRVKSARQLPHALRERLESRTIALDATSAAA